MKAHGDGRLFWSGFRQPLRSVDAPLRFLVKVVSEEFHGADLLLSPEAGRGSGWLVIKPIPRPLLPQAQ